MSIKELYSWEEVAVARDIISMLGEETGKDYTYEVHSLNQILNNKDREEVEKGIK